MHVLSIVGPTATGKSQFALNVVLAAVQNFVGFEIISADSRQVYQGMEIGTGADLPADFVQMTAAQFTHPFWQRANVRIHGLSMIKPTADWSVSHFQELVREVIKEAEIKNHLVILVGGTGLYHSQALQFDPQLQIPPNLDVREKAVTLSLLELQEWLEKVAPEKWQALNQSDRANPRRLVRAIEVGLAAPAKKLDVLPAAKNLQEVQVGLTASPEFLEQQITQRVHDRLENGMEAEVQQLVANYSDIEWKLPAFSATGYKEVRAFLEGVLTREQLLELWTRRELQYAKRQLTWWKKQTGIEWFDVVQPDWKESALQFIRKLFIL